MPLLNITLQKGKDSSYIKKLSKTIHDILIETWGIPSNDYFQVIHQAESNCFFIDRTMWDMQRTEDVVVIHITSMPRTQKMKLDFYKALPPALESAVGLKPDNVFISIVSNQPEDWSFGKGIAQLLEADE